jgi:hypothetical protein
MEDRDEKLAHELLVGAGGKYLKPGSELELKARTALARILRKEAPDGWFTQTVADLIGLPPRSAVTKQKIVFVLNRSRGTPVMVTDRRRAEIAAFMQEQLETQKRGTAATVAQARNQKRAREATMKKFGISRSTFIEIWREFSLRKGRRRSPNK